MRYLRHDSGEAAILKNGQVLGDDSPLEFGDDGRAGPLEDDVAEKLVAMHKYVSLGRRAHPESTTQDTESADGESPDDEFDAEAFVARTPMETVIEDIESGEADGHLDEVEEAAERVGVQDAIEDRRE